VAVRVRGGARRGRGRGGVGGGRRVVVGGGHARGAGGQWGRRRCGSGGGGGTGVETCVPECFVVVRPCGRRQDFAVALGCPWARSGSLGFRFGANAASWSAGTPNRCLSAVRQFQVVRFGFS
jgi:hypothetical protein